MTMRKLSTLIFLAVNLVFFTLSSACDDCSCEDCPIPPPPPPPEACDGCMIPFPPPPPTPCDECMIPPPQTPCETSPPPPPAPATCPIDVLKLGVCANLLGGLIDISIGTQCCPLFEGLSDLEAANCACSALKANILGIQLDLQVSLGSLLNGCSKTVPSGCQCG